MIFACKHRNYSWPLSRINGQRVRTYVACLDCGKELLYDWDKMQVVRKKKSKRAAVAWQKVKDILG